MSRMAKMRQAKSSLRLWSMSHFEKVSEQDGLDVMGFKPIFWTEEMVREQYSFVQEEQLKIRIKELVGNPVGSYTLHRVANAIYLRGGEIKPTTMILQKRIKVLSRSLLTSVVSDIRDVHSGQLGPRPIDAWVVMVPSQGLFLLSNHEVLKRTAPAVNPEIKLLKNSIKRIKGQIRYRERRIARLKKQDIEFGPTPKTRQLPGLVRKLNDLTKLLDGLQAQLKDLQG